MPAPSSLTGPTRFPSPPPLADSTPRPYQGLKEACLAKENEESSLIMRMAAVAGAIAAFIARLFTRKWFLCGAVFLIVASTASALANRSRTHEYMRIREALDEEGFCEYLSGVTEAIGMGNIKALFDRYTLALRERAGDLEAP